MGHGDSKRLDLKRKIVEDEVHSLGYGTTSVYHLEELYGKILSLHAQVKRLEACREDLTETIQIQEEEIKRLEEAQAKRLSRAKKHVHKRNYKPRHKPVTPLIFAVLADFDQTPTNAE